MKTVAVLGASSNRDKYGNKAVRAYQRAGYEVYPVNPKEEKIEGLPVFDSLADVPVDLDRITVYLPPLVTRKMIPEIAAKTAKDVFFNPGSTDKETTAAARAAGIPVVEACSIVAIGLSPALFS